MSNAISDQDVVVAWNRAAAEWNKKFGRGCWAPIDGVEQAVVWNGWTVKCLCGLDGIVLNGPDGLVVEGHDVTKERRIQACRDVHENAKKRRGAMFAMSNVMRCVDQALTCARFVTVDWRILDGYLAAMMGQQMLALCELLETKQAEQRPDSTLSSEEWSRRVREGVKALPKPGPVVTCQSEED